MVVDHITAALLAHTLNSVFRILLSPKFVAAPVDADGMPERHRAHRESARAARFFRRCVRSVGRLASTRCDMLLRRGAASDATAVAS